MRAEEREVVVALGHSHHPSEQGQCGFDFGQQRTFAAAAFLAAATAAFGFFPAPTFFFAAIRALIAAAALTWWRRRQRDVWERMLDRVLPAIVVIRVNYVKPFDGDQAGSAHATGFVVDFERGIIVTNRHVIGTGPIRAEATFVTKEEVPLTPLYRDPVHDFGFFHFDNQNI